MAGPFVGRLLLRLVVVAALLLGLWRIRPAWSWGQRLIASTLLITLPMFIRPLMTDYVEWTVLVLGMALTLLALRPRRHDWRTAVGAGVLAALMAVANPFAVSATLPPLAVMALVGVDGRLFSPRGLWRRAVFTTIVVLAAACTVVAGYLYFRWAYGIDNIYEPTITFIRNPPGPDPLKSPNIEWLTHFTWLFLPPLVIAAAALTSLLSPLKLDRTEWLAVGMAGAHYGLHWLDQFGRNGSGLEISYYWSMSFCTLGIAFALVTGRLATGISLRRAAIGVGLWVAALLVGVPDGLRLPSGIEFGLVSIVVVAVLAFVIRHHPLGALAMLATYTLWLQIGAPNYDPSAYHPYNLSPRYDHLFWGDGHESEAVYDEARWLEREVDGVADGSNALFFPVSGWASTITGIYDAHLGARLLSVAPDTRQLRTFDRYALLANSRSWLVMLGIPDDVERQLDGPLAGLGLEPPVLDETHDGGLGYRLVVIPLRPSPRLPLTFEASELPTQVGEPEGDDMVTLPDSGSGFVTFGPYVQLGPGSYTATVSYRADGAQGVVGRFDAFSAAPGEVAEVDLVATAEAPAEAVIHFEVTTGGQVWELRTATGGVQPITVDKIELETG